MKHEKKKKRYLDNSKETNLKKTKIYELLRKESQAII
jgi:hypothetical protein